jgi:hypothetical protein
MKRLLPLLAIVIIAAVVAVVIVLGREPSPEAAPVPPVSQPGATTGGMTTASPTTGGTAPDVRTEPTATAGRAFGSPTVTMRGTNGDDHVACGAIQPEFAVSMASGDGKVRWTGQVRDVSPRQYPFDGEELRAITLEPATGLLELGQRQLVRILGTFGGGPGSRFYVVVSAPNANRYRLDLGRGHLPLAGAARSGTRLRAAGGHGTMAG